MLFRREKERETEGERERERERERESKGAERLLSCDVKFSRRAQVTRAFFLHYSVNDSHWPRSGDCGNSFFLHIVQECLGFHRGS